MAGGGGGGGGIISRYTTMFLSSFCMLFIHYRVIILAYIPNYYPHRKFWIFSFTEVKYFNPIFLSGYFSQTRLEGGPDLPPI